MPMPRKLKGFTLVELSIVLVILGLLVGGVLAGQSLIRAAELRAVSTEFSRYQAAAHSFRDKYFALPGDMTNATAFWGKDNTNCAAHTGSAATPGTCNGNGDGRVPSGTEQHRFWQQLALSGLIEGSYTGLAGGGGGAHCIIGTSCPRSKLSNAGWGNDNLASYVGDSAWYRTVYNNLLVVGAQTSTEYPSGSVFKPEEAWNIDTKMDDGRPAYGSLLAVRYATCTTSTGNTDMAGVYRLNDSSTACALTFVNAF